MSQLSALLIDRPTVTRAWRVTAVRGVLTLLFAFTLALWDVELRAALAACAIGAAALDAAASTRTRGTGVSRPLMAGALLGLLAALLGLSGAVNVAYASAAWLLVTGLTLAVAAGRVRRPVPGAYEWLLGVAGWGQATVGLVLLMFPAVGPRALDLLVAGAAGWAGLMWVLLATRLHACRTRGR